MEFFGCEFQIFEHTSPFSIFISGKVTLFIYFGTGIILHCICCDVWMDKYIIRIISNVSSHLQFHK